MDSDIIFRHNQKVPSKGSLWICLGDFAFVRNSRDQLKSYVRQFNGEKKILVMGNHDREGQAQYLAAGFDYVIPKAEQLECSMDGFRFVMRHKPYTQAEYHRMMQKNSNHAFLSELEPELESKHMTFDKTTPETWLYDLFPISGNIICGHVHQLYRRYANGNVVNVGVDAWDMSPVKLMDALALLDT